MKNGSFVLDAHTGFWDASKENCKNRFGDAFIETFYAFHTGFNPPEKRWTMDYETQFRKVDPDWYLEEVFITKDPRLSRFPSPGSMCVTSTSQRGFTPN